MSIKTTRFKQKVAQARRKGVENLSAILPGVKVGSPGRKQVFVSVDGFDDEGQPVRAGRRYPGRPSSLVSSLPMGEEKRERLLKLWK